MNELEYKSRKASITTLKRAAAQNPILTADERVNQAMSKLLQQAASPKPAASSATTSLP